MSRLGKIARLPRAVRDTLNVRLQEGEPGPELLTWLNAQPAVQTVLAAHFDGHPVNAQNLSDWRRGGHAVWCQQQQILELAERLHEEKPVLDEVLGDELGECLAQASLLTLVRELKATWGMEQGPDRLRAVLAIVRATDRLQRTQLETGRASREQPKEERPAHRPERSEELRPPAEPAQCSPSAPDRPPADLDDEQLSAIMAAAMKLAARRPEGPVAAARPIGPKLPVLQAA